MKQFFLLPLLVLLFTSPTATAQDSPRFERFLPEDVFLYAALDDFSRTSDRFDNSPMRALRDDPAFAKIRDFFGNIMSESENGEAVTPEIQKLTREAFDCLDGPLAVAVMNVIPMVKKQMAMELEAIPFDLSEEPLDPNAPPEDDPDLDNLEQRMAEEAVEAGKLFFVAMKVGDNQKKFHNIMLKSRKLDEQEDFLEKKIGGRTYFVDQEEFGGKKIDMMNMTYVDGYALVSGSTDLLANVADNMERRGADQSLATNPDFMRVRARAEKSDGMFFVNLNPLGVFGEKAILDNADSFPQGFINAAQLAKALDLKSLGPIGMTFTVEEEGIDLKGELGFQQANRLSRILMPYVNKEALKPDWIPASVASVSSGRIDFSEWYKQIIGLMTDISPQIGASIGMGRMMLKGQFGIDPVTDILDKLGDSVVTATFPMEGKLEDVEDLALNPLAGQPMILAISLKDQVAIQQAIQTLLAKSGAPDLIKEKNFQGQTIYSIPEAANAGLAVEYSFLDNHLLLNLGQEETLRSVIRSKNRPRNSIWNSDAYKQAAAKMDIDKHAIGFTRTDAMISTYAELFNMMVDAEGVDLDVPDFSVLGEVFGNMFSTTTVKDGRMLFDALILYEDK